METLLSVNNISKRYGSTVALEDVSFEVKRGEIHVLLGENGAGKSSIMKVISGNIAPDSGSIILNGKKYTHLTQALAKSCGIAMVHQELSVFEELPVYENIFAGEFDEFRYFSRSKIRKLAAKKLDEFGLAIPVDSVISSLTPGEKQLVEILRATAGRRNLIILDEPTSSLTQSEANLLFDLLRRLRHQGVASLFVSHRISEVRSIGDRITILRDGQSVETFNNNNISEDVIVEKLVGRSLTMLYKRKDYEPKYTSKAVKFSANFPEFKLSNLQVREGEIHGFYGLDGSGVGALSEALFGLTLSPLSSIQVDDEDVNVCPESLLRKGVAYLSADRKVAGLFHRLSVLDNIAAPHIGLANNLSRVDNTPFSSMAKKAISDFSIKIQDISNSPSQLSGGNQQKVMISTIMSIKPRVIIVNEPTRGIDIITKLDVHRYIINFAALGGSVIIFSGELPELIALADHLTIMRSGYVAGTLSNHEITERAAISLASRDVIVKTTTQYRQIRGQSNE